MSQTRLRPKSSTSVLMFELDNSPCFTACGQTQLTYMPDEQAQLRSMLDLTAQGLDRYTIQFVLFINAKYQAAGYSVVGTDLEVLMHHVGVVPP